MHADTVQMFAVVRSIATFALELATLTFTGQSGVMDQEYKCSSGQTYDICQLVLFLEKPLWKNHLWFTLSSCQLQEAGNSQMLRGKGKAGNNCERGKFTSALLLPLYI